MGRNEYGKDIALGAALALFTFLLVVLTANQVGITYDEPVYAGEATRTQAWLEQVVARTLQGELLAVIDRDLIATYWRGKDMQPSLLKWAIALVSPLAGLVFPGLSAYRAATALFAALMVASTFGFARAALGRTSAAFAAMTLIFLPHVFALAHLMSLDVPVVAMTVTATWLYYHAMTQGKARWFLAAGVALGLGLAAKMNAVLVVPAVCAWMLVGGVRGRVWLLVLASGAVAAVVFVASWPFLWIDPMERLAAYARFHFKHYPVHVTYFGRNELYAPWHYPLVMLAITTPLVPLLLMAAGSGLAARQARRAAGAELLWLISCGFQLLAFISPSTPKYNGVRLFLASFPFLALFAGLAFDTVAVRLAAWSLSNSALAGVAHARAKFVALLFLAGLLPGVYDTMDSHPHGMSFYNAAIGGTRGAWQRGFEATYWGDAFYHTLPWLNEHAERQATIGVIPDSVDWLFTYYQSLGQLRDDLRITNKLDQSDFVVLHARPSELRAPDGGPSLGMELLRRGRFAFAVRYGGTTLAAVVARKEVDLAMSERRFPSEKSPDATLQNR